ncbi:hypothetical protein Acr_00g0017950 [Actinidia rufa]|uniref:Uncharacterized protein n=1 Tax=Actinidia rufa TaxID=165716 RepID=A0A7J0DD60_9ERIC|nr:hypothetical protein Acr_00g0017950 [Actinidia rufa]
MHHTVRQRPIGAEAVRLLAALHCWLLDCAVTTRCTRLCNDCHGLDGVGLLKAWTMLDDAAAQGMAYKDLNDAGQRKDGLYMALLHKG